VPKAEFQPHVWQLRGLQKFDSGIRFLLLNWHRRARKTTLILNILIREAVKKTKSVVGYIAPTYRQAKAIVWRDPNMLSKYLPEELVIKKNESELFVEFKNGSVLVIKGADQPDSLRGIDFACVGIDEWALMKPEIWEEILRPVIAQNKERFAIFAFTPKGRNHAFRYTQMALQNPEWFYDCLPVSVSKLIPNEELERLRKEKLPENVYRQEFECEFLEDQASVFKGISKCIAGELEEPKVGYSYVIGVDLAKTQDFTVLACICRETRHLVAFERLNEVSWNLQKEKIILMARKYNNAEVLIDATGLGDPILEDLQRARINVSGYKFTNISKQELVEKLIIAIEQRLITFPRIDVLISELESFEYDLSSQGVKYSAPEGLNDDCVIALALAVWQMGTFLYTPSITDLRDLPRQAILT